MADLTTPLDGLTTPLQTNDDARASAVTDSLRISHAPIGSLIQISGWAPDFEAAVLPTLEQLGLSGLGHFDRAQIGSDCICFRTAPNRLLIWQKVPEDLLAQLGALDPAVSPILDLSHGRVQISVSGVKATDLMTRLTSIDLRDRSFPMNAFAQTEIHHTSCLIFRSESGLYELLLPSSYARSLWSYICDVARPLGLQTDALNS